MIGGPPFVVIQAVAVFLGFLCVGWSVMYQQKKEEEGSSPLRGKTFRLHNK